MSGFASMASGFARDAAVFAGAAVGERVIVTPRRGAAGTPGGAATSSREVATIDGALVYRDPLTARSSDGGSVGGAGSGVQYPVVVQIPMALYPGTPNVKADVVAVAAREGDTVYSEFVVARIIGQVAGMWHLGLE